MPLAGRMKLQHFLLIVGGVVVAAGGAAVALYEPAEEDDVPQIGLVESPEVEAPVSTVPPPEPDATQPPDPPPPSVSEQAQAIVLGYRGRALGATKQKDVTKGKPYKVNVYQDEGHGTANRAKVDLDRDDLWDQKYTFHDDGSVSVKTATADDENYDVEETLALRAAD